jgi:predicted alpha/beta-hydrolase family hydrolase
MMYSFKGLEIKGYRNELVPNTLLWQERQARQVAIMLPGIGYTCQMPLLYYASQSMLALGMDVLWVEYNYLRRADYRMLSGAEQNEWHFTDVTAACRIALAQRSYLGVTLIGKSMGTRAMAHLIANEAGFADCRDVWLTPVLRDPKVREQIKSRRHALVVIGTADPYYDSGYLAGLRANTQSEVMAVEGADHSMEIQGDVGSSLMILEKVTRAIQGFVSSSPAK